MHVAAEIGRDSPESRPLMPPPQGRAAQMDIIRRALGAAAEQGVNGAVLVEGEAGIGRSTLLAEASGLAECLGFEVVHCRAHPAEGDLAHGVARRLLASLRSPQERSADADLHEFGQGLVTLSHGAPLLLVVDDLQWCDGPSLHWLSRVVDQGRNTRVVLLGSARTGEDAAAPLLFDELATRCRRTTLVGLGADCVERLVRSALPGDCDPEFLRAVLGVTGGNPRLLRALLDELAGRSAAPDRASARNLSRYAPESAAADAYARIRVLGRPAVAMAEAVAVLQGQAELPVAARLADLTDEEAARAVDLLVRACLLTNQQPLAFRHPLVATAIVRLLPVGTANALHAHAARLLYEAGAEESDVAEHLLLISPGYAPWVCGVLHDAGRAALTSGRPQTAVRYLRRAMRESRPRPHGTAAAQPDGAAEPVGAPDQEGHAAIAEHLAGALLARGRGPEARAVLEETAQRLTGSGSLALRLEAQALATTLVELSPAPEMDRRAARLRGREWQDTTARQCLDTNEAVQHCRRGESADRAEALARNVLAKAVPVGFARQIVFWANVVALSRVEQEDLAFRYCDQGAAEADRRGDPLGVALSLRVRSRLEYGAGRLGEAAEAAREAAVLLQRAGIEERRGAWLQDQSLLAHVLLDLGETAEAAHLLGPDPQAQAQVTSPELGCGRGHLLMVQGDVRGARDAFLAYGRLLHNHGVRGSSYGSWRSLAARALAALGELDQGRRLAEEELELARRWDRPRVVGTALHSCALVTGGETGLRLFERATAVLKGAGARLPLAQALADHGSALRVLGRTREAGLALTRAAELATACSAFHLADRAGAELDLLDSTPATAHPLQDEALPPGRVAVAAVAGPHRPQLAIRCFGGFRVRRGGQELDCSALRPKVRALLQLLAVQTGRPVHRERLLCALWPDLRPDAGIRNLQVTVSQLRRFLEPEAGRGERGLLLRDGESYHIALQPGDECDVQEFERTASLWRRTRSTSPPDEVAELLRAAQRWYAGSLMPELGPTEWVVTERRRLRMLAADVSAALAEVELALGRPAAASEAALRSLELDAYRDASWRVLIAAHRAAGSTAAADRARRDYDRMIRAIDG